MKSLISRITIFLIFVQLFYYGGYQLPKAIEAERRDDSMAPHLVRIR